MWSKCKKQATFSKSSSLKTSHCSNINSTSLIFAGFRDNGMFTDESPFNVDFLDGWICVWRRRIEQFDPENVIQRDCYGGRSVMVWDGVSFRGKTMLVAVNGTFNSQKDCDEIFLYFPPFCAKVMQEPCSKTMTVRTLHVTQTTLQQNNIDTLDWPARSPDLSLIKHVWNILGRCLRRPHNVNNVEELTLALQHEWKQIKIQAVRNLIRSMRCSCMAVTAANGDHSKYWNWV